MRQAARDVGGDYVNPRVSRKRGASVIISTGAGFLSQISVSDVPESMFLLTFFILKQ